MNDKYAVVAVHDVAPRSLNRIIKIDDLLKKEEIDDFSYLVIPKYHGQESQNIAEDWEFADVMKGTGQELVMHGYTHSSMLMEDEFFTDYKTAWHHILDGRKIFRSCFGYRPKGFIPPMWMLSRGALKAVSDAGFDYTSSSKYFYDLRDGMRLKSTLVIRGNILAVPSTFNTIFRRKPIVEVALHPQDTSPKSRLLKMLINYLRNKGYRFMSYKSLLEEI